MVIRRELINAIRKKRQEVLANLENIYLHQDNAHSHTAPVSSLELGVLGFNRIAYPPYSPDLGPMDFSVLPAIKSELQGISKMFKLLVLSLMLSVIVCLHDLEWEKYKQTFNKIYEDAEDEKVRRVIWLQNRMLVEKHNNLADAGHYTYWLTINHFSDRTEEELYTGTGLRQMKMKSKKGDTLSKRKESTPLVPLPQTVDWRDHNRVTGVKDQGECNACYAFAAIGAIEGLVAKRTGRLEPLSEQKIIDCTFGKGNHGCNGGYIVKAFEFVRDNGGIDNETNCNYIRKVCCCRKSSQKLEKLITGWKMVQNESDLQRSVANEGPVATEINTHPEDFRQYKRGVFNNPNCNSTALNHAVLVVGYGTDGNNGIPYWIIKNSWGKTWGEDGYMKIARNRNMCGIGAYASFPIY